MEYREGDFVIQSGVLCKITLIPSKEGYNGICAFDSPKPSYFISGLSKLYNITCDPQLTYIQEITSLDMVLNHIPPKEPYLKHEKLFIREALSWLVKKDLTNVAA